MIGGETRIGDLATGEARLGNHALWQTGSLAIGYAANGSLQIDAGGIVDADEVVLGDAVGARGQVLIGDAPATGANDAPGLGATSLIVGHNGTGSLQILGGGYVDAGTVTIRSDVFLDNGGVLIEGSGGGLSSRLTAASALRVGVDRPGSLEIRAGAVASAPEVRVGEYGATSSASDSRGEIKVSGFGGGDVSRLNSDYLWVGATSSQGTITVLDSAVVTTEIEAVVGSEDNTPDATALVRLTGPDAVWTVKQSLQVVGNGRLEVTDGAVTIGDADVQMGSVRLGSGGYLGGTGTIVCQGIIPSSTGGVNNFAGTVGPGNSPGTLTIEGSYTQGAAGVLEIEIGGLAYDRFVVSGDVTFEPGAKIRVTFLDPNPEDAIPETFTPRTGDTFTFLSGASINLPTGTMLTNIVEFANLPEGVTLDWQLATENGHSIVKATTTSAPDPLELRVELDPAGTPPGVSLTLPTSIGKVYSIEYTAVLPPAGSWSTLVVRVPGTGDALTFSDGPLSIQRFYRATAH